MDIFGDSYGRERHSAKLSRQLQNYVNKIEWANLHVFLFETEKFDRGGNM